MFEETSRIFLSVADVISWTILQFVGANLLLVITCAYTETFWEVISVPESKAYRYVDTKGEQFVRYTRYKLCRIYPAGYRIDSSNPNPQTFWNCGCQLGENIYNWFGSNLSLLKRQYRAPVSVLPTKPTKRRKATIAIDETTILKIKAMILTILEYIFRSHLLTSW